MLTTKGGCACVEDPAGRKPPSQKPLKDREDHPPPCKAKTSYPPPCRLSARSELARQGLARCRGVSPRVSEASYERVIQTFSGATNSDPMLVTASIFKAASFPALRPGAGRLFAGGWVGSDLTNGRRANMPAFGGCYLWPHSGHYRTAASVSSLEGRALYAVHRTAAE